MQQFEHRVAVVTGSASGLGRAMALTFAREGMSVVVADRRKAEAEQVAEEIRAAGGTATAVEVDVTSRASVEALADTVDATYGNTHVLCNNAGVTARTPLLEPEEDGWRWMIDVNLMGVVYCIQTFVPRMLARGEEGHVVTTCSVSGLWAGLLGPTTPPPPPPAPGAPRKVASQYAYTATKYAVVGISEALSGELAGTPIGVSAFCPNAHYTDFFHNSAENRPQRFGGPTSSPGRIRDQIAKGSVRDVGMKDPMEAAARVVDGIRSNQLFIITHPQDRPIVEARAARLLAGYDHAEQFPEWRG